MLFALTVLRRDNGVATVSLPAMRVATKQRFIC